MVYLSIFNLNILNWKITKFINIIIFIALYTLFFEKMIY